LASTTLTWVESPNCRWRDASICAAVLSALLIFAGERALDGATARSATDHDASLDEEWVEQPVLFGLGCGDARQSSAAKPVRFVRKSA